MKYAALLVPCLGASMACADTLWLDNGDQLTGKILYMTDDSLVFDAKVAGRVDIGWKKVSTFATDDALKVVIKRGGATTAFMQFQRGESGTVLADDGAVIAVADIKGLLRPRKHLRDWRFEGNVDVSTDIRRERDDKSNNIDTRVDTRVLNLDWRHVFKGEYTYETEDEVESERNYSAEYDLDYFFLTSWYWRILASTERDYFDDDKRDNEYGTGPGYQFWDDEQGRFGVNLSFIRYRFAREYEDAEPAYPVDRLRVNAIGLDWDFKHSLPGPDLEFYATGSVYRPDTYGIDYLFKSDSGIRYHLNGRVNFSLNIEHDELKSDDVTEASRQYTFGVGVDW